MGVCDGNFVTSLQVYCKNMHKNIVRLQGDGRKMKKAIFHCAKQHWMYLTLFFCNNQTKYAHFIYFYCVDFVHIWRRSITMCISIGRVVQKLNILLPYLSKVSNEKYIQWLSNTLLRNKIEMLVIEFLLIYICHR